MGPNELKFCTSLFDIIKNWFELKYLCYYKFFVKKSHNFKFLNVLNLKIYEQ